MHTEYTVVETGKIGTREFRENLAGYLEAGKPFAITGMAKPWDSTSRPEEEPKG